MAGTINSLGLGSGVLTADIIDKLRNNDKALTITPIDGKITLAKQKTSALDLLSSLLTSFKTNVNALDDDTLYQKRSVSGNNSAINVNADTGVAVQSFSISNTQLAKQSVFESGRFSSLDSYVSNGSGSMALSIDGQTYNIGYDSTTTLDKLKTEINNIAGDKVKASTLQVGENDYRLILTSVETGANQSISIADSTGGTLDFALYKQQDVMASGLFSSDTLPVASGAVAQSDRFDLSATPTTGDLSITIDGTLYSANNGDFATNLAQLQTDLEGTGKYTVSFDVATNSMTLTAATAGVPYTLDAPLSTNEPGITTTTTPLAANVTPAGTYDITMNGITYSVAYNMDTTLQSLAAAINATIGSDVASVKQVGTTTPSYELVIASTATGDDPTFAVADSGGFLSSQLTTGIKNYTPAEEIQKASDASFKYNGITISRSTNEITDIITGVTINLLQNDGSSSIAITQDINAVSNEMGAMVQNYNTLMDQLNKMTLADTENSKIGIFNGDSTITNIRREITKMITSFDDKGYSLSQFGIDLNQEGVMSFSPSTFMSKFKEDTAASELFFSGLTQYNDNGTETRVDGIFTKFNAMMERYTGSGGIMSMLSNASDEEIKTLTTNKTRAEALLNARYDSMTARFIEYDTIISKLNSQFSSLNQQIQMAINSK